jgi:hypothetical protein
MAVPREPVAASKPKSKPQVSPFPTSGFPGVEAPAAEVGRLVRAVAKG